jgi:predicted MFS family arabinose efflux permease
VALDRFGPRLCLVVGAAITMVGAVVFAAAASPGMLILGRALLGLGTAGSLVASLAVYAHRFPPDRFATLTGLQIGFGTVGALLATAPLAFSTATIGWRGSFLAVGAFTGLVGLLIAVVVRDEHRARGRHETLRESWSGILSVLRTPSVGRLFVMNLVMYSTFGLIVGLWGGPYLTHVYGYSLEARGSFLVIPVLTQIVGSMMWGPMDRLMGSHKRPVLIGAGATAAALGYLALVGTLSPVMLVAWFAVFGFVSAFGPVLIAHGKALFSLHQVGRGLTVLNMVPVPGRERIRHRMVSHCGRWSLPAGCLSGRLRLAGSIYPIGLLGLFACARSQREAPGASSSFVPCVAAQPVCTEGSTSLTFPLAICALRCMLLRCGSASRYRRPPWAFPP